MFCIRNAFKKHEFSKLKIFPMDNVRVTLNCYYFSLSPFRHHFYIKTNIVLLMGVQEYWVLEQLEPSRVLHLLGFFYL